MSEEKDSKFGTLLITGLFAILGTVAGGVIKGYWDISLADKKFQTELVMKSLEAPEPHARITSLRFMIETNLINDTKIKTGLEGYLKRNPDTVPQFQPPAVTGGVVVPSTPETVGFTDFDVFLCDAAWENKSAQATADAVIAALKKAERVGQIRLKQWESYDEVALEKLLNKLTIVVDSGHGESREVPRLDRHLKEAGGLPEIQVLDNPGKASPWLISIVVCPSQ